MVVDERSKRVLLSLSFLFIVSIRVDYVNLARESQEATPLPYTIKLRPLLLRLCE